VSTGDPGIFYQKIIENFVTVKAKEIIQPAAQEGVRGTEATSWPARSTGNPGFFREFFIEKFITVNAQGNFQPEGPGGGKGV
jgi:hypothetical protein